MLPSALLRVRGEVDMDDDRSRSGNVGRGAVGLVPDRLRFSEDEGRLVMMLRASGFVRSWAADMDGRSLRGVTDPLAPTRVKDETSSPLEEGPAEEKNEPFCDLLSVEEVP